MMLKQNKWASIVLIALLSALALVGLYFGIATFGVVAPTKFVDVPTISVQLTSKDGTQHSLEARFSLEIDQNADTKLTDRQLHDKVTKVISELDYEKLKAKGGTQYLKQEVMNNLASEVEEGDLLAIYLTDVISDAKLEADPASNKSNKMMKGLFKNIKED